MAVDLSVFGNQKSLIDFNRENQARNLGMAVQQQALQTGALDQQLKKNQVTAQLLNAATASGDQGAYDAAKQQLAGLGIDTSAWAPDVASGQRQAQAAQMALISPGTLLNAGLKQQSNDIAAAGVNGTVAPTGSASPLLNRLSSPITHAVASIQPDAIVSNQGPGMTLPTNSKTTNLPPLPQGAAPASLDSSLPPQPTADDQKYSGLNPKAKIEAFKADLDAWNANPAVQAYTKQASAKAETLGKDQGDAQKDAISADQGYQQTQAIMDSMADLVRGGNIPDQKGFISPSTYASLSQNIGSGDRAAAYNKFKLLNEAQTIGAIRELANTGQIRMTRTLENIINQGYLVNPNSDDKSKLDQINTIKTELENSRIAAQNINSALNGGAQQPMNTIPVTPAAQSPVTNWVIKDGKLVKQ